MLVADPLTRANFGRNAGATSLSRATIGRIGGLRHILANIERTMDVLVEERAMDIFRIPVVTLALVLALVVPAYGQTGICANTVWTKRSQPTGMFCIGGVNDGLACAASGDCPGGTCGEVATYAEIDDIFDNVIEICGFNLQEWPVSGGLTLTGPLLLPDGTFGAPGLSFSADIDTGLHRPGIDLLSLVAGGAEAVSLKEGSDGMSAGDTLLFIPDLVTPPTTNPTGGVYLFSDADTLKIRNTAGTVTDLAGGGGGTNAVKEVYFTAAALRGNMSPIDFAPSLIHTEGTNIDIDTLAYDDTVNDECAGGTLKVPIDLTATGSDDVTFRAVWYSSSQTTGDVLWEFRHLPRTEGEDWDATLTVEAASADATQGTIDQFTFTSWTETVTGMGIVAGDELLFLVCRNTVAGDTLTGDAQLVSFSASFVRE